MQELDFFIEKEMKMTSDIEAKIREADTRNRMIRN